MAAKTVVRRRADGSIAYRVPFRIAPGGKVTSETFESAEGTEQFRRLLDRVGGQAARDIRTASTSSALDVPTRHGARDAPGVDRGVGDARHGRREPPHGAAHVAARARRAARRRDD
ncbi:hypothetical protein [Cellulomonas massiliensis]|uniref:hypothetical protein n=1 Tax=Cellulomonas massiliensis TaxID=1465811 RepID=UPI0003131E4A|nr:hypothetical protein [Cellulomonas massiliensis]